MSTVQNSYRHLNRLTGASGATLSSSIILFNVRIKTAWVLLTLLTISSELVRIPPMPSVLFDLYYGVKVVFFFSVGFISPLAFYKLNRIGLGLVFSFLSALLIEVFQGLLSNGHSFHWYELAGKLALIALGFAIALDRRYERKISLGPVNICFRTNEVRMAAPAL
jgi:hypothetical protein